MGRAAVRTILEALAVTALGLTAGLVANAASDSGIALGRDHLRRAPQAESRSAARTPTDGTNATLPSDAADPTRKGDGLFSFIEHAEVVEVFHGTGYDIEDVFVDARADSHYTDGHIPGAYQLDHFRAERYLPELVPICTAASRVIIYCTGGDCDDSKLAAEDLMMEGVDPARILIYKGGINQWRESAQPIELGARLSGEFAEEGQ